MATTLISDAVKTLVIDYRYHTRDRLSLLQFSSMGRRDEPSSPALRQRLATERWLAKPGIQDSQNMKACLRMARIPSAIGQRKCKLNLPLCKNHPFQPHPFLIPSPTLRNCPAMFVATTTPNMYLFLPLVHPPLDWDNNGHDFDIDSQSAHEELSGEFTHDTEERSGDTSYDADGSVHDTDDSVCYGANDSVRDTDDSACYSADDSVLTMDNDLPCPCDTLTLQALETLVGQWRKEWGSESTWSDTYEDALGDARAKGGCAITIFLDECAQHIWEGRILLDGICDVAHTHCPYCREWLKYDTILLYDLLVSVVSEVKFFEVKLDTGCD
ncbi:uncharacterized protein EDB91DRAFT_1263587 [Suillus paluster]|uniref:uncharacterized protein n=1 Tax=Suillus paluster TaxID=48578 RepID=UPI001B874EEE|nr:uncharacterized protein EDB91DRAFT_1263587 [Suillus paluster]KAG1726725.1 hypothetical protein EDB91DRAFT_1263587 [Suillus paluster]